MYISCIYGNICWSPSCGRPEKTTSSAVCNCLGFCPGVFHVSACMAFPLAVDALTMLMCCEECWVTCQLINKTLRFILPRCMLMCSPMCAIGWPVLFWLACVCFDLLTMHATHFNETVRFSIQMRTVWLDFALDHVVEIYADFCLNFFSLHSTCYFIFI